MKITNKQKNMLNAVTITLIVTNIFASFINQQIAGYLIYPIIPLVIMAITLEKHKIAITILTAIMLTTSIKPALATVYQTHGSATWIQPPADAWLVVDTDQQILSWKWNYPNYIGLPWPSVWFGTSIIITDDLETIYRDIQVSYTGTVTINYIRSNLWVHAQVTSKYLVVAPVIIIISVTIDCWLYVGTTTTDSSGGYGRLPKDALPL